MTTVVEMFKHEPFGNNVYRSIVFTMAAHSFDEGVDTAEIYASKHRDISGAIISEYGRYRRDGTPILNKREVRYG